MREAQHLDQCYGGELSHDSFVALMQATDYWKGHDNARRGFVPRLQDWRLLIQKQIHAVAQQLHCSTC